MSGSILSDTRNIYEQQVHNRRMTWFIMLGIILLFGAIGFGIDYFYLGVFNERFDIPPVSTTAVVMSVAFAIGCLSGGSSLILKSTQATQANPSDTQHKQLLNIAQEMSLASGLPVPKETVNTRMSLPDVRFDLRLTRRVIPRHSPMARLS